VAAILLLSIEYSSKKRVGESVRFWLEFHEGIKMHKSIEGIFRDGKIELLEPAPTQQESRVVVTFMSDSAQVDLREKGISENQAQDLRARLRTFNDDWNQPEMDVYDDA
jgi:hypothetical protein